MAWLAISTTDPRWSVEPQDPSQSSSLVSPHVKSAVMVSESLSD